MPKVGIRLGQPVVVRMGFVKVLMVAIVVEISVFLLSYPCCLAGIFTDVYIDFILYGTLG